MYCTLGQPFGANANGSYAASGMDGHPATDEICGYGSEVEPYWGGTVCGLFTPQDPATNGYTAVFILCQTELELVEHSIGHLSEIFVKLGDVVTKDTVIGKEGNKGLVYAGSTQITQAMQEAGDKRGTHRHVQWRPVIRQKETGVGRFIVNRTGYFRDSEGYAFKIYDWDNGYNGCVNLFGPIWTKDLFVGSRGYEVYVLQKALKKEGFFTDEPTGYFGPITASAVAKMQKANGLSPALGYFGPKTREVYNKKYPRLK